MNDDWYVKRRNFCKPVRGSEAAEFRKVRVVRDDDDGRQSHPGWIIWITIDRPGAQINLFERRLPLLLKALTPYFQVYGFILSLVNCNRHRSSDSPPAKMTFSFMSISISIAIDELQTHGQRSEDLMAYHLSPLGAGGTCPFHGVFRAPIRKYVRFVPEQKP